MSEDKMIVPVRQTNSTSSIPYRRKQPSYIIHTETRNISFIQTATDLKVLGVKNNLFFLALYDPSLKFVDPHDPDLTKEQKFAVLNECLRNPYYFIRECVRIPEDGGTGLPYLLNRGNLASLFCFIHHIDHYLVLPRQKGKTQSTISAILWAYNFGTNNTEMMFINKQEADANNNLDRLKKQRDLLPPYLKMSELITTDGKRDKGVDNVKSVVNPVTNNKIVTKPSAGSLEKAEGLGRGCTQTIQYYDETEFTPYIKTIVEAAGPAFNTASKNAKRNGAAYCRIMSSTPGDLDSKAGQDANAIVEGCAKWTENFYDWTPEQIAEYVKTNSENGITYIEYSYKQLGEGEEWFIEACLKVLNNPVKIRREILLQRMNGSNRSPFETEHLQAIKEFERDIIDELIINRVCRVDIYKKLNMSKTYIVSVDCASGEGNDAHAVTIIDPYTTHPVAEFKANNLTTPDLARFITVLVSKHIPKAIITVERNYVGIAVMQMLQETVVRSRVYYEFDNSSEVDKKLNNQGFVQQSSHKKRLYGVWTGTGSRGLMMEILEDRVINEKRSFVTKNIIRDLMGLIRTARGRIDHAPGGHDDSLMSYLVGLYVIAHGKNLAAFGFKVGSPDPEDIDEYQLSDIEHQVQANTLNSILSNMDPETRNYFEASMSRDATDLDREMYEEMKRVRHASNYVDQHITGRSSHSDDDGFIVQHDIPIDFFDSLND